MSSTNNFETTIFTRSRLFLLLILIAIGFIALFTVEAFNYRYLGGTKTEHTQLNMGMGMGMDMGMGMKEKFNVPIELEQEIYPDINNYIKNIEDKYVYDEAMKSGCYDDDRMMEQIRGPGKTCKSIASTITNISYKPEIPTTDDVKGRNPNYFITSDGVIKSYAEICPTTSKEEHPLRCLHEKVKKLEIMGKRVAKVIDNVQNKQDNRIHNVESTMSQHIVDNQRLYNKEHTRDFLRYEKALDIPEQTMDGSAVAVLQYAASRRAEAL